MHAMFIHPNFPAQFGHIAAYLKQERGWECTFLTSIDTSQMKVPFRHCNYRLKPGPLPKVFYNPGTLQELMQHAAAVYRGLKGNPQIRPDLVVGHMSYGTMLYLRNLYDCPFVGYYEMLPPPFWSKELALRPEFPPTEEARLSNATYHTFTYLHLHMCDAGYTPTQYQLSTCPKELQYKLRVIHDGVDCDLFQRRELPRPFEFHGRTIGPNTRVLTYVSRGLESARGFDIFMKVAKRVTEELDDVLVLIAGDERTNYGHEKPYIGNQTFKQYVLSRDKYDLQKIQFLGRIPLTDLPVLYSLSDLHIYLTTPWVLSWSMMQAMANGCVVLGSATAPVMEVLRHEENGLLADFYDVDGLARLALQVLRDPPAHRRLGEAARQTILERYEKRLCIEQLVSYFQEVLDRRRSA
ncbi:MAG: glycosyltransferase [Gemmatales bacterium]|nr:glycosyltransferase [Gemmatales bacterium]MDW8385438.1 glycosyltransferase [Gemmatales bacterium]